MCCLRPSNQFLSFNAHNFSCFCTKKTKLCTVIEPCRKTVCAKRMFGLPRFPISLRSGGGGGGEGSSLYLILFKQNKILHSYRTF